MAFFPSHGTGYGYSGFPAYSYPATFAPQAQFATSDRNSQAAEGSQAGDEHGASQQQASVSGFADPNAAVFAGQPWGFPAQPTFLGGEHQFAQPAFFGGEQHATILPGVAPTALVPLAAPRLRRPGYNERLVAWRNRQKAFNRYKKATKLAIKNANRTQFAPLGFGVAPTILPGGACPVYDQGFGGFPGCFPSYGQTYLPAGGFLPTGFEQAGAAEGVQEYGDFTSYSSAGAQQQDAQQEEPEIRGTQV